ncbi:MAG: hypothetical protein M1358_25050 [Chloroflexi bacterium]|nr:hypothetical protein [Chloroflexota bacterium]
MERRFLTLDDVLEIVVYLLSAARNAVGGTGQRSSILFLDCALRLISGIQEEREVPPILDSLAAEIEGRRDLLAVDAGAYIDSLDDLIRLIARDMISRATTEGLT